MGKIFCFICSLLKVSLVNTSYNLLRENCGFLKIKTLSHE